MQQTMPSGAKLMILEQGTTRTVCLDDREEWTLGRRDPRQETQPELCLNSRLVSRIHGWLTDTEGNWFFTDSPENRNGTWHNGRKLTRPRRGKKRFVMLSHGDVLRIGGGDVLQAEPDWVAMLFIADGRTWEAVFLRGNTLTLTENGPGQTGFAGHDGENLWLSRMDGKWYAEPPTFPARPLCEGDRLRVGDCEYVFLGDRLAFSRG